MLSATYFILNQSIILLYSNGLSCYPFPKRQILDSSKLKEFVDDNFELNENGRKFSKLVENTVEKEKLLVTSNFSFSHSVFK